MVPETVIFSDFISDTGLHILALIDACKVDHTGWRNRGMQWPVFTVSELVAAVGVSEPTIKREVSKLKKLGLLKVTRTRDGNGYELLRVELDDDTFRGRENVSSKRATHVTKKTLACGVSSGALRLWMILDRIKGKNEWAYASQKGLADYLGVSERTIIRYLNELRDHGLVEVKRRPNFGTNDYRLLSYEDALKAKYGDTVKITKIWMEAALGPEWMTWVDRNGKLFDGIFDTIDEAIHVMGANVVISIVDNAIDEYAGEYPPDFLIKVLDEILDDLGARSN